MKELKLEVNKCYINRQNDLITIKSLIGGYGTDEFGNIYNESCECISKIQMIGFENVFDLIKEKE